MAVVITLPQTDVPAGPGSVASGSVPVNVVKLDAVLQQVAWPLAGDKALDYVIEQSNDGGATWLPLCFGDMTDVAAVASTIRFGCTLRNVGLSGRRVRLSWNLAKALTISGTVSTST
jgi:hypothetical protein